MIHHAVLGSAGEVGRALMEVLTPEARVFGIDWGIAPGPETLASIDILHVAIGYDHRFADAVRHWHHRTPDATVVIHSTVPVGTSDTLGACFSPVTGKHPHLAESLRTFDKPVAGPGAATVVDALLTAGILAYVEDDTRSLEASKLIDLAAYGISIRLAKEVHRYCREHDLDYDVVWTSAIHRYNAGYHALGETRWTRPDIRHVPGPIGGHCVTATNLSSLHDERIEELLAPATPELWDPALD